MIARLLTWSRRSRLERRLGRLRRIARRRLGRELRGARSHEELVRSLREAGWEEVP
ncbi:MAG TPA: hypothetical protein VNO79_07730 [Actinomycetota bacterium]|nr:hypothetical protein [Actinomycetota bacterium]